MTALLWVVVLLPLACGAALCLLGRRVAGAAAPAAAVAAAAVTLAVAGVVAVGRPSADAPFVAGATFGLAVDGLSAVVLLTVTAVTLLVLVFAAVEIRQARARFNGLMLLFEGAVVVTVLATNLPTLLAAWEVMGATSYALIGFWWRDEHRVASGAVAFITTRAADLGLYAAAAAALAGGGSLTLAELTGASPGWRSVVAAGLLLAALGKAAQLPFSFWLSRAMEGPSPVSALLHSAAMVAMGGYLLLRVSPLLDVTGWTADVAAWVGAATAVMLGAVALAQRDLKQLLAASTASQLGFVVAAAGVGAVAGGAAQLVAHAATKALLFLAAGAWLSALGTKQLTALRGVGRRWTGLGVAAGAGLLSLGGVAPLALWATKDDVIAAARQTSVPLFVVLLLGALLSAGYAAKALVQVWRLPLPTTSDGWDDERPGSRSVHWAQRLPVTVLAAGAVSLELLVLPPFGGRFRAVVGRPGEAESSPALMLLTAAGALAVVGLAVVLARRPRWLERAPRPASLASWLYLEQLSDRIVVRPVTLVAQGLARFDDGVLDAGVERLARLAGAAARGSARLDDHVVDAAVERLAAGARSAGRLARRPQTGQLHQYYLQAVVVLAAAFLLLIVVR